MNNSKLKLDIINIITNLEEDYIVEDIKRLLDFELDNEIYHLSPAQKRRIVEAETDNLLTEIDANKQIEEWLNEK